MSFPEDPDCFPPVIEPSLPCFNVVNGSTYEQPFICIIFHMCMVINPTLLGTANKNSYMFARVF